VPAKVDVQKQQPKSLLDIPPPLLEDGRFQRVEQGTPWISPFAADAAGAQHGDEFYAADAFKELLNEGLSPRCGCNTGQRSTVLCERPQGGLKTRPFRPVTRFHDAASFTIREIQSRIALIAPFVTPKLLWILWL
jgi:hypothetical protein